MEWSGLATQMTSIITSFTIIGGALIWIYRKLVSEPDKRMAEKIQQDNTESLKQSVEPLTRSIDLLNHNLADSAKDREQLNAKVGLHDEELNDHDKRISILEIRKIGK